MFATNKYAKIYFAIVEKARNRIISECDYRERHHIIPKSLGGTDELSNLIELTAREHFICHLLLVKMTTNADRSKMASALHKMSFSKSEKQERIVLNSSQYDLVRRLYSRSMRGSNNPRYGVPRTEQEKANIRQGTLRGMNKPNAKQRILTEKGREAQRKGRMGWVPSDETRAGWSEKRKGRPGNPTINLGKKWYTDGIRSILTKDPPSGFYPGRS